MRELGLKRRNYFKEAASITRKKLRIGLFLSFFVMLVMTPACDDYEHVVPDLPFSFTVDLNIRNDLTIPGNSVLFPGVAYGGVIVYCEQPGSWYAFDATCTYEVSQTCTAVNDGVLAECPCCGSQYILINGQPSHGPAAVPLRQYNVSQLNYSTLRVYN